jgi:hypothetical protein
MRREWFSGHTGMVLRPKYRRLSPAGKGALLHLWNLASYQSPEATWNSRDELLDAFELEGFDAGNVDELIALHWLDIEQDGTLAVHDWDQWQMAASVDIRNAWQAAYMREWRHSKKPPLSLESLTPDSNRDRDRDSANHTQSHVITETEKRPDVSLKDDDDVSSEAYLKGPVNCGRCGGVILGASFKTSAGRYHSGGCPTQDVAP